MSGSAPLIPSKVKPMLSVIVHTEEAFDWRQGVDKNASNVEHLDNLEVVQTIFDQFLVKPTYVVDYPVAVQKSSITVLKTLLDDNRAEIGAHLQPWVSPPFEETINDYNSFPCNLPYELEFRKLENLTIAIRENFGIAPVSYLAGRYGAGKNTVSILRKLKYEIDLSASPPFDYRKWGGPDYSQFDSLPTWLDDERKLLSIPGTGAYVGFLGAFGPSLHNLMMHSLSVKMHLPGVMAKLGLVDRLRLSPEGYTLEELKLLTQSLYSVGVRHFCLSFHSPSIQPGNTSYVNSNTELTDFLQIICDYLSFFSCEFGGEFVTPGELKSLVVSLE